MNAYYYQSFEMRGSRPIVIPVPGPIVGNGYTYGAIAYRTVQRIGQNPAYYQVGTAVGHSDANRAAREAAEECGPGCGYFSFYDGCAGIAFYRSDRGINFQHGFHTKTELFATSNNARRSVERSLEDLCDRPGFTCEETRIVCTNE